MTDCDLLALLLRSPPFTLSSFVPLLLVLLLFLSSLLPSLPPINHLCVSPTRSDLVFIGGAVLADIMASNPAYWVTKAEWDEQGARALEKFGPRSA